MSVLEKRCFKCEALKPVEEFYRNRSRTDGYADNCKECQARYRKLIEEKNPGKIRQYNQTYYAANRDRLLAQHRDYARRKAVEARKQRLAKISAEMAELLTQVEVAA